MKILTGRYITRQNAAGRLASVRGVAALLRVTGGNFRLMDWLLTQGDRILELNDLKVVPREVVEAARAVVVISTVESIRDRSSRPRTG